MGCTEFCLRGYSSGQKDHTLVKQYTLNTEVEYVYWYVDFWNQRFEKFGSVYLLPHHFKDLIPFAHFYATVFRHTPTALCDRLMGSYVNGLQNGFMVHTNDKVSSLFPETKNFPGDFDNPYNEDVLGPNLVHTKLNSLAQSALMIAVITGNHDFTVGCHHIYDPMCYLAGILGTGKHCLASSIKNYLTIRQSEPWGDIKLLGQVIDIVENQNLISSGLQIKRGAGIINSNVTISNESAFGKPCAIILEELRNLQEQERDARFKKLVLSTEY